MWNDRITKMFNIDIPLILAPMAGAADSAMAIGVAKAGGLGSIACAMLSESGIKKEVDAFRRACPGKPLNLNFFCHQQMQMNASQEERWLTALEGYYREFNIDPNQSGSFVDRKPFDESTCKLLESLRPEVVSFHCGLPEESFIHRLKNTGCKIISSATMIEEAVWLEKHGCDAIIAQGIEAGGHRGMFLTEDLSSQLGTFILLARLLEEVQVPIIVAGGIANKKDIEKILQVGASAVQIGTAYLLTKESKISPLHRAALLSDARNNTVITNVFTGKPARSIRNRLINELGPMSSLTPPFPYAGKALAPLKAVTEKMGSCDFMSLWCGEKIEGATEILSAEKLTLDLF